MAKSRATTMDEGVAALRPAFEKILELVPAQARDKLFPNGITLIEAKLDLDKLSFELRIQGPDGKPPSSGTAAPQP